MDTPLTKVSKMCLLERHRKHLFLNCIESFCLFRWDSLERYLPSFNVVEDAHKTQMPKEHDEMLTHVLVLCVCSFLSPFLFLVSVSLLALASLPAVTGMVVQPGIASCFCPL